MSYGISSELYCKYIDLLSHPNDVRGQVVDSDNLLIKRSW